MVHQLQYGQHKIIQLLEHSETEVTQRTSPNSPLDNPVQAVVQALKNPLGFPSLHLAATPGDRVVIALDDDIPNPAPIIAGILEVLECGGVDADNVLVLRGSPETPPLPNRQSVSPAELAPLGADLQGDEQAGLRPCSCIQVLQHDPRDRQQLAYLAANQDGNPIYLNRHLVDADLVVPVTSMRLSGAPGYFGVFGGLLPKFSDEETLHRFQLPPLGSPLECSSEQLIQQCDEAAWLLGTMLAVQVISTPSGDLQGVLAGVPESLATQSQGKLREHWSFSPNVRATLVVATLMGGESQQTWANLSRALHAAGKVVEPGGVIVLCTDLQTIPPLFASSPVSRPVFSSDPAGHSSEPNDDSPERTEDQGNSAPHHWFPDETQLYLLSALEPDVVEDVGWGCLRHPDQLQRLADQHQSWILLEDAQHLRIAD